MKKIAIMAFVAFVAALAASAVSCNKSESIASLNEDNSIAFGVYTGRAAATKVDETTTATIEAASAGFGVLAYYTAGNFAAAATPNFMWNQQVTKDGDAWTYSPKKYWPKDLADKISFFAYAPYNAANTGVYQLSANNAAGAPTIAYSASDLADAVDVVVGQVMNANYGDSNGAANSVTAKVTFALKHILTRVKFVAQANAFLDDESEIVIKSVKFNTGTFSLATSGTYTFNSTDDNALGTWATTPSTSAIDLASVLDKKTGTFGNYSFTNAIEVGNTPVALFANATSGKEYIYLIPSGVSGEEKVVVEFTYDVVTKDSNLAAGYVATEATKTVQVPANLFQMGKSCTLSFKFELDKIDFSASVGGWDEISGSNSDVAYQD